MPKHAVGNSGSSIQYPIQLPDAKCGPQIGKPPNPPITPAPDTSVVPTDQPMDQIFKAVKWSEKDTEEQQNEQQSWVLTGYFVCCSFTDIDIRSLEAQGQEKVAHWMRDGLQYGVLYCDLLPDISNVVRPVDKSSGYMDMLPWWNPDFEPSTTLTTTGRTSPTPQLKSTSSLRDHQTDNIKREKTFHESITNAGGRPWYPSELIDQVASNPGNYAELLEYWKQDPTGSKQDEWMVFERQLERWNQFRRYQLRVRRNPDTFEEYLARCNKCLSKHSLPTPIHLKQDLTEQDSLSQWLEYLCLELSECKKYSWYKRYHQQYETAWQTLVGSKVLSSRETRDQVEDSEYIFSHDDERTSLRQSVEEASSNVLLAERDLLNPTVRGPIAQRKLFEAQAELDSAIKAFDHFQRRRDAVKEFRETTFAYREARNGARRHQMLLRWVGQQLSSIQEDLGLSSSTEHLNLEGDELTETDSDESDDQNGLVDSSSVESLNTSSELQRNESKKRSRLESIAADATLNSSNAPPKRSRHGVNNGTERREQ
ncbi:hypothetical protein FSARC_6235 [Fusarium sarcochroum]|uniref:Uncharacterized protein n=1 Tax=Fusarium sarcochroum TaxID=1208366 RepID=A0A8H4X999_9HYPO|nr:hypothetical protein FSARC_6235 [Fusarium sarcochroum]